MYVTCTFYVRMGQVKNGRLYLNKAWEQLCDSHCKIGICLVSIYISAISVGNKDVIRVLEEASSHWLTSSLILESGLRFDANCPVGIICGVVNLYITKSVPEAQKNELYYN